MRTTWKAISSCCLLLAALALAGCASSSSDSPSSAEVAAARVNREIELGSPALVGGDTIPSRYTCDGGNAPLPLQWTSVPPGTKELALLILSLRPVRASEGRVTETVVVLWAAVGLRPTLRQITAGHPPRGAIVGRDAQGHTTYSICPPKGARQNYLLALFALPRAIAAVPGFSDETLFAELSKARVPFGQLLVNYTRA
jgi:phosphatidylethanolamine-binding protein (PEBP) family uncharacterized protein